MRDNLWGTPSKVFISDKPLLEGSVDLPSIDENFFKEFDCEVHNFDAATSAIAQESIDNARFVADERNHSISMEVTITKKQLRELRKMLQFPKLPRKLKKYVKRHYFDEYPKRVSRIELNFAFAANNPYKAKRVGMRIIQQERM
jgi:hypothetical protein